MCTVVLDFYSDTCSPCKAMARDLDEIQKSYNIEVKKLNIFDNYELTEKYNIRSVPTLIVLEGDKIKATYTKYTGMTELQKFIQENVQ